MVLDNLARRIRWTVFASVAFSFVLSTPGVAQQTVTGAIQTQTGNFITAVNGGGLGGPNYGSNATALHTDATTPEAWETFSMVWVNQGGCEVALQTVYGNFVTAVNGGGMGGPNTAQAPIHTDATTVGTWEMFTIQIQQDGVHAFIQTPDHQHYITAVNGGGFGGPNNVPIHTDATQIGSWEQLVFKPSTTLACTAINTSAIVTRRQFAVQIQQQFGLQPPANPVNFPDVPPSDPNYIAIEAVAPYMNAQVLCPTCMLNPKFFPDYPITNGIETLTTIRILQAFNQVTLLDLQTSNNVLSTAADSTSIKPPARPYFATAIQSKLLTLGAGNKISPAIALTQTDVSTRLTALKQRFTFPPPANPTK